MKVPTMNTTHWLVYTDRGTFEAATVYAEMAAAMVAVLGEGATVRPRMEPDHVVWREGAEEMSAGDSYDTAALTMQERTHNGEHAPEIRTGDPVNGADRCECGCKYWSGSNPMVCLDCGTPFRP